MVAAICRSNRGEAVLNRADLGQRGHKVNKVRIASQPGRTRIPLSRKTNMKRLTVLAASLALLNACALPSGAGPADAAPAAPPATVAAEAGGPVACPIKTDILYKPEVPEPGFVPAAPRGSTVVRPQRIHSADPSYPSASRRCHEEGKVVITYCVSADGKM